MSRQILETEQKALEINLNNTVYGSFAEIGAGQEVAGCFFDVGASSGTIAKSMSAYDKLVSDDIYGIEQSGRYVCQSRLYKMLDHEYSLMVDRLASERPNTQLFAFADTIETLNYHKTNKGQGWLGIRFQSTPYGEPNELILHVEMLDNNTRLQQMAVGMLGVNMVYACFSYGDNYQWILDSLMDNLQYRIQIDLVRFSGPYFKKIDNRLVALELVKKGMTPVAILDKQGNPLHASEFVYKKEVLAVRGGYQPTTIRTIDRLNAATKQFYKDAAPKTRGVEVLAEITLHKLKKETGKVENQDFLDRVDLLNHLGQRVMITNCNRYKKLIHYLMDYRVARLGLVMGTRELLDLILGKYQRNKDGRLLVSFGEVFTRGVQVYAYPAQKEGSGEMMTSTNMPIPQGIQYLYKHILDNKQIVDIEQVNQDVLHIYSAEVLRLLRDDTEGWEEFVPEKVATYIREKNLFRFPLQRVEFEY
jgi:hypothetical protein